MQVEVPREDPRQVRFGPLCARLRQVPACTALLGLDEEGVPVLLRLPSADVAHVLIAGNTGSGKTVLARTMALSLATHNHPREVQLVLIDPKRRGFGMLGGLPHLLTPLIYSTELGRSVDLGYPTKLEKKDSSGNVTETISGQTLKRATLHIKKAKKKTRDLGDAMVVGGLIYGLVNVRTDGEKILCATLDEKNNDWRVKTFHSRF